MNRDNQNSMQLYTSHELRRCSPSLDRNTHVICSLGDGGRCAEKNTRQRSVTGISNSRSFAARAATTISNAWTPRSSHMDVIIESAGGFSHMGSRFLLTSDSAAMTTLKSVAQL